MGKTASGLAFENHDLKAEAPEARAPAIRFAFEFPRLLEDFRAADARANEAKRSSRRTGYLAISLVLIALLIASAAPVWHELHLAHEAIAVLGYLSAILGIIGAILAFLGMRKSSSLRIWLRNRLTTESMRLFHFQYLAARLPELASIRSNEAKKAAYLARRDEAYTKLKGGLLTDPEAEITRIAARSQPHDYRDVPEAPVTGEEEDDVAASAMEAWRVLRLDWQLGYAEALLARKRQGKRVSAYQTEYAFSIFGWTCVAVIVGLHIAQFAVEPLHLSRAWMEVAVIWTALAALAGRALEEGLQPQREVERYEHYRASIIVTEARFQAANGFPAKLEVVRAFERNSIEEMRIFMRTHARSRFML
ncbi:MAG: hypothetical protein SGJ21_14055 [Alphaproteobacteria bacterium]|nr:hypothetical protein [Alphaproteobacteria bacterium]